MLARAEERIREIGHRLGSYLSVRLQSFAVRGFFVRLHSLLEPCLHHLREDEDWKSVPSSGFTRWLKPGGRLYVSDLAYVRSSRRAANVMWKRYGDYLESLGGKEYRAKVFDYIDKEDSPRSLPFQLDLLKSTGFTEIRRSPSKQCLRLLFRGEINARMQVMREARAFARRMAEHGGKGWHRLRLTSLCGQSRLADYLRGVLVLAKAEKNRLAQAVSSASTRKTSLGKPSVVPPSGSV